MEKLKGLNEEEEATILMVTHDSNAASYCSRILFIQDGAIFHEIRRDAPEESRREFYERILKVMAQLGGGSEYVFLNLHSGMAGEAEKRTDCFSALC